LTTQIAKTAIRAANSRNADIVNEHKRKLEYEVGNQVMLSTRHFSVGTGRVKKLAPKWIGPFKIVEKYAEGSTYKLELPETLRNLHHTFHVSLLKQYHPDIYGRQIHLQLHYHLKTGHKNMKLNCCWDIAGTEIRGNT